MPTFSGFVDVGNCILCNILGNDEMADGQSGSVVSVGESASATNVNSNAMDVDVSVPFALVDEIADASPAAEDGIQFGDQFVKFGNVKNGDNLLRKIASGAQSGLCCACYGLKARCTIRLNGDT